MRYCRRWAVTVLQAGALLITAVTWALANGAEFGFGAGTVFPLKTENVRLESEHVEVWLPGAYRPEWDGLVVCDYRFTNLTRQRQDFTMGFVADASSQNYPADIMGSFYRQARFSAEIDGRLLAGDIRPVDASQWPDILGAAPDSVPVWSISLGPGATQIVEIRHRITSGGGGDGNHVTMETTYRARPAALWAETIANADITFHLDPLAAALLRCNPGKTDCVGLKMAPDGYTLHGNSIRWEMTDWEPAQDFTFQADWYEAE